MTTLDIQKVIGVTIADAGLSVLLATAFDSAFPDARDLDSKPIWQVVLETGGQTLLNIIILLEVRSFFATVYSDDPTGGFIPNALLLQLQPNLLRKYIYLCKSLSQYSSSIFQPAVDPQVAPPAQ